MYFETAPTTSITFQGQGANRPDRFTRRNEALKSQFQNCKLFQNRLNRYPEIVTPRSTENEHVYAICSRPEVAGDVSWGFKLGPLLDIAIATKW